MKLKRLLIACFAGSFILLFCTQKISAQNTALPNSFLPGAIHNTSIIYHQSFGDQKGLYNGGQYIEYPFKFKEGDPYFFMPQPSLGSVFYDGIQYDSVLMRYDEIADEVAVNYYGEKIRLLKTKVEKFSLFNADFVHIKNDSLSSGAIKSGFYNLLYNGKICLLKREVKTIRESISTNVELQSFVEQEDYYYIKKDGKYYPVKSKNAFFDLLADKKSEVKEFIRTHNLNYRKGRQYMLTQTTAYYDSLKK